MDEEGDTAEPVVLLVDDSDDSRELCAQCLELLGFRVVEARTGPEAVELAAGADLVLMDLSMPGVDGMEAARRIRRSPRSSRVPMLALTGLEVEDVRNAAYRAGFDRVLAKPCLPEALARAVRDRLREREREREGARSSDPTPPRASDTFPAGT